MNKIELKYSPYILKFKKPFETSNGITKERKGFIISLKSDSGNIGLGDAAPFPEIGSESYEEAISAVENVNLNFKIDLENIEHSFEIFLAPVSKLPALRHGFEQAMLNLISKEKHISLNQLLNCHSQKQIKTNAVIGIQSESQTVEALKKFIAEGFDTIKIKAGRDSFEEDLKILTAVRKSLGKDLRIRIDVNGKWKLSEAVNNLKKLESLNLEYVEQPVRSISGFVDLRSKATVPIAVDEPIRSVKDAEEIIANRAADFLVLKPMMLGGIIPTIEIINLAGKEKIKCIITSSFESVIGRSMAVFAASLTDHGLAHGLNTGIYFENDLAPDPYPVKRGIISLLK